MNVLQKYRIFQSKYYLIIDLSILVLLCTQSQLFSFQNYAVRILIYLSLPLYFYFIIRNAGFTKNQIGITSIINKRGLKLTVIITFVFSAILLLFHKLFPQIIDAQYHYDSLFPVMIRGLAYIVISVPVQELLFRGYLITRLEQFTINPFWIVLISSAIFGLAHVPFGSNIFTLATFGLGIFAGIVFLKFRNLLYPIIIHSVLGLLLMILGLK